MNLTRKIKEDWLSALRSGKYQQGSGKLRCNNYYCCLGVLACVLNREIDETGREIRGEKSSYYLFKLMFGETKLDELWKTNDQIVFNPRLPRDYSNVIPLIEKLPTID